MMKKHETKVKAEESEKKMEETAVQEEEIPAPETEEVDPLQKELEEALTQKEEYLRLAQMQKAEFENFKRRNQSVRADALAEGKADAVLVLLPVLDNLERAVAAGGEGSLAEGVQMVLRQFTDALKTLGVTEIPCNIGDAFDANLHNAVLSGPADEEHPEGTILNVLQKGYQLKEKVLRYTMVQVAQ